MVNVKLVIDDEIVHEDDYDTVDTGLPADAVELAEALQDAIDNKVLLTLPPNNMTYKGDIVITVTEHTRGITGLNANGAKLEGSLTIKVDRPGIDFRYLIIEKLLIDGTGKAHGLVLACPTNDSWIYNWCLRDVMVEGCTGDGIALEGSVFEGSMINVCTHGNGGNGVLMRHKGGGQISAIGVFGGAHRKNGRAGMALLDGARDVKQMGVYYVENKGPGLHADQGFTGVWGCGFENNGGTGILFQNFGNVHASTASSNGPQQTLAQGYLSTGAALTLVSSGVEGYGGHTMKTAKIEGNGEVFINVTGVDNKFDKTDNVRVRTLKE